MTPDEMEERLGRILGLGTIFSTVMFAAGLALWLIVDGRPFVDRLLNAGIIVLIVTPVTRVVASTVIYIVQRDWQAMVTAMEYGVEDKILLGSDFPSGTIDNVINGLRRVNLPVEGSNLPKIPKEIQDQIIYENWKRFFTEWH